MRPKEIRDSLSSCLRFGLISAFLLLCLPIATTAADKLRIGYGAPSIPMALLWITEEGKLFAKNGLEVEVLYLESSLVQRALIAGNIAYGEMTGPLMAAPTLQGADLVMLAGFLNKLTYRMVTRSEIRTIKDLKGKRLGVSRFGAGADRATRLLLTRMGLSPEKDVVLVQVGGAPTRIAALTAGIIDATIVEPPDHKKAQESGMTVLANMEEMNIPFQHTGLVTTRAQVAKAPHVSQRVVKSFIEGIQLATVNPEVTKRAFRKHLRLQQERDLDDAIKYCGAFCRENLTLLSKGSKRFWPSWRNKFLQREQQIRKVS